MTDKKIRLPARASIFYLMGIVGSRAVGILTTPLFTRAMTEAEYGSYSYYISILSIASMISGVFLLPTVFYSGLGKFSNNKRGFADTGIILSSGINLCICIVLFTFNSFFGINKAIAPIILLQIFFDSVVTAELQRYKFSYGYKRVVAINLSSAILGAILSLALVFGGEMGAAGRILGLLISGGIISGILIYTRREGGVIGGEAGKFLLKNALPLIPAVIARASVGWADKLIIKRNLGDAALAKYSVAHTVGTAALALIGALSSALNPWMIRKLKAGDDGAVLFVTRELSSIISWGSVTLLALAPEIFAFLAPKSYSDALYVIAPFAISSLPFFLFSIASVLSGFYERTRFISLATALGATVSIILNIFLVPRIGFIAGGIAYLAAEIVMYLFVRRLLSGIGNNTAEALKPKGEIYFALVVGGAFLLLYGNLPLRILLLTVPLCEMVRHGFFCLDLVKEV
jgi:O-antigen/teichoic acid export membrane protein